jgi:hypothetical protein
LKGSIDMEHGPATAVAGAPMLTAAANAPVAISTADATVASLRCGLNMVTTFPNTCPGPIRGLVVH